MLTDSHMAHGSLMFSRASALNPKPSGNLMFSRACTQNPKAYGNLMFSRAMRRPAWHPPTTTTPPQQGRQKRQGRMPRRRMTRYSDCTRGRRSAGTTSKVRRKCSATKKKADLMFKLDRDWHFGCVSMVCWPTRRPGGNAASHSSFSPTPSNPTSLAHARAANALAGCPLGQRPDPRVATPSTGPCDI